MDVVEIDLDKYQSMEAALSPQITVNGQDVFSTDLQILRDESKWLNKRLINAGQRMLHESFPETAGLYDMCYSDTLNYPRNLSKGLVQILNVSKTHWICVSSKGCKPNTVKVYDSQRSGDLPLSVKEVIAALIRCDKKKVFLLFPDVQQQANSSSCGIFALAFASTLCEDKDPAKTRYDFPCMRAHFLQCLQQRKFTSFPSSSTM